MRIFCSYDCFRRTNRNIWCWIRRGVECHSITARVTGVVSLKPLEAVKMYICKTNWDNSKWEYVNSLTRQLLLAGILFLIQVSRWMYAACVNQFDPVSLVDLRSVAGLAGGDWCPPFVYDSINTARGKEKFWQDTNVVIIWSWWRTTRRKM